MKKKKTNDLKLNAGGVNTVLHLLGVLAAVVISETKHIDHGCLTAL